MPLRPGVRRLLRLRRDTLREELDDEIRTHIEYRTEQLIRRGLGPDAARAEAERRFNATDELYRTAREREWTLNMREWLATVRQDAALTLRGFARYRGFTAAVVATLALGIGATMAIVTVVDGVLLRPLPYADPERLYALVDRSASTGNESSMSPLEVTELRRRTGSFSGIAGVASSTANLSGDGPPRAIAVQYVFGPLFDVLGTQPLMGTTFRETDELEGAGAAVILSHGFWQSHFGGDPGVLERTVRIDGRDAQVLGVMPAGFSFANYEPEAWLPLQYGHDFPGRFLAGVARLAPGVTVTRAEADLDAAIEALLREQPEFFRDLATDAVPLRTRMVGDARPVLIALAGAVALLLLIACANVANLLLARSLRRQKELAVRLSLGASRARVVRQLFTESAILAIAGGAAGMLLAIVAMRIVVTRLPDTMALPRTGELTIDLRVALLALAVTAVTTLLFGLAPAFLGARADDSASLLRGARGSIGTASLGRARSALVVAQVALVAVLLVSAGLLGRSFVYLMRVDMGFETDGVVAATVARASNEPQSADELRAFFGELLVQTRALPGVEAVGMTQSLPLSMELRNVTPWSPAGAQQPVGPSDIRIVGGDYFHAMSTQLVAGRMFGDADGPAAPRVFLVNRALARHLGDNAAIGQRIQYSWGEVVNGELRPVDIVGEIIGIVEDVQESGPAIEAAPALYRPYAQDPWATMTIVARTTGDATAVGRALEARVHEIDPNQPVDVKPLDEYASILLARPRMQLTLIGTFATIALLLAGIGLYGVVAYMVDQRRQEIGVRLAVGATPPMMTRLVVSQGLALSLAGLALGAIAAVFALPVLRSLVFGVALVDPVTIGAAAAFVVLVTVAASVLPARRAARIDPMAALRVD